MSLELLSSTIEVCHPERSIAVGEANGNAKSRACPELAEGDLLFFAGQRT